jgi:hypothetical protein
MTAYAEEIKLQCNVKSKYTHNNGKSERESGTAIIDMNTSPPLSISVSSSIEMFNPTVHALNMDNATMGKYIINNSNSSKWDVYSETLLKINNFSSKESFVIDRNTGSLFYRNSSTLPSGETGTMEVSGTCSKVDTTKRKF